MRTVLWAVVVTAVVTAAVNKFSITVSPRVMQAGAAVVVTCYVPRDAANRTIIAALRGFQSSERSLDGEAAAVIHRFEFKRVECGLEEVSCTLLAQARNTQTVTMPVEVGGCEP